MQPNMTSQPQHMGATYRPAHSVARTPMRRVLCTAGLTALLALTIAPAAHADLTDDIPDSSWTPDVPSIDNTETPTEPPVDPGPGDDPGTGGDPGTGDNPGEGDGSGGEDWGGDDSGWTEPDIPDSGSDAPDYNYYPPASGGTGAASEWAFYDPAEPPAEAEPDPNAEIAPVEAPVITVPVFTSYDPATRTLSGTAQPGAVVRIADAEGNPVVEDVVAAENGVFSVVLPEGVDLAGLSIYVVNENGEPASDALAGATIVEEIARQELAQVRTAVGTSTSDLASGLMTTVGAMGIASSVDQIEEEGMPALPYIFGAAAGVVAVGAVVGGIVAIRRRSAARDAEDGPALVQSVVAMPSDSHASQESSHEGPSLGSPFGAFVDLNETGSFSAVTAGNGTSGAADDLDGFSAGHTYAPPARPAYQADALDDIEMLAMNMHGGSSPDAATAGSARSTHTHAARTVATGIDPDDDPLPPRGPGEGAPMTTAGDTAAFLAVAAGMQQGGTSSAPQQSTAASEALHAAQGAAAARGWNGDPDVTLPGVPDGAPQDIETFRRTAYLLATGTGTVHRVTKSYENLDLSGLDTISSSPISATIVGDSFVADDDWQALALAELQADAQAAAAAQERERPHLSTDDYVALVSTQRRATVAAPASAAPHAYVAPVVGPVALGHTDAVRRHAMLKESMAPAAIALRNRDEEFKSQRTYTFEAQRIAQRASSYEVPSITGAHEPVAAVPAAPVAAPQPQPQPARRATQAQPQQRQTAETAAPQRPAPTSVFRRAAAARDDVPVIARGATSATPGPMMRATSVSDRVPVEKQSFSVPDPAAFAPVPVAPVTPHIPQRGVAAAVAAAQNVYAAFAPVTAEPYAIPDPEVLVSQDTAAAPVAPAAPEVVAASEVVASSVAAAYAAAVYENVHVPEHYLPPSFTAQLPPVSGHASLIAGSIPAVEIEGDFSDPYNTETGYSAAYINYMVQDEFEHRHDTPAQRNAALGRMRIVNGAACAPVPLSESVRHRHPA